MLQEHVFHFAHRRVWYPLFTIVTRVIIYRESIYLWFVVKDIFLDSSIFTLNEFVYANIIFFNNLETRSNFIFYIHYLNLYAYVCIFWDHLTIGIQSWILKWHICIWHKVIYLGPGFKVHIYSFYNMIYIYTCID